jgi:activator of 2-hydroxyglutaryl-CoA dehydratase/predicted nucleotide-binding protein (sugar kinase/HSP70/actin superfamily)
VARPPYFLVDAGIEKIHFRYCESGGRLRHERSLVHRGRLAATLEPERAAWNDSLEGNESTPEIYLTGKLSGEVAKILGRGTRFLQEAVLFRAVSCLFRDKNRTGFPTGRAAVIDFSASGYGIAAAGEPEEGHCPPLVKNPACGAGSGVNLRRILDKLDIALEEVDKVLAPYQGEENAALRRDLPVRTERCGVFSVSATVSDKNQGIPTAHALAVTMKSEVGKPCSRVPEGVRVVYLTGGVFRWQFVRDCAGDCLRARGVEEIRYDGEDTLMFRGLEELVWGSAGGRAKGSFMTPHPSIPLAACPDAPQEKKGLPCPLHQMLPSFRILRGRLADEGRYVRLHDPEPPLPDRVLKTTREGQAVQNCSDARRAKTEERGVYRNTVSDEVCCATQQMSVFQQPDKGGRLTDRPVHIAMDMGSSMAKMVIADALSGETLYRNGLPNRGDALQTVRHFLDALRGEGVGGLRVQHWGLTGSGRYQIGQILKAVYPHLWDRILTMVENEAHALGSLDLAQRHICDLKRQGHTSVNEDFALLVDIGGEDTKISVISLKERALVENAMNCKCSAGTGSLMDVLKDLLDIPDVAKAYRLAEEAPAAWSINATCAVFLMEEARKMQARGIDAAEILASCCYAIVENMARTLWRQVNVLPNTVVLLHGQTMLSDPLALATIRRLEALCGGPVYGLVPPHPGHRACDGLIGRMAPGLPLIEQRCDWELLSEWRYERTLFHCSGAICGNKRMRCTRTTLSSQQPGHPLTLAIGGCTTVNERPGSQAGIRPRPQVPDAYREIWQWLESRHPQSQRPDRLVIPRCFSLTREAYLFAVAFERLGLPVHCDAVQEGDMGIGSPFFALDTCAPNMGAAGQCIRLAGEHHGLIFLPQLDFLPTQGTSLGRTCTTNQGGIWAAVQFARQVHPRARFLVAPINLGERDPLALTRQIYRSLGQVFDRYGVRIDLPRFRVLWQEALEAQAALDGEKADLAAGYLERAAESETPVTIVCGREYVLNPGVYDNHISKMLKDKGILPVPSYAFDTPLDLRFAHIYWKTAHEVVTKAAAVAEKRLHETVGHPRLKTVLRRLEKERTSSLLSHAVVTTFHCGPDSVTVPLMQELSKTAPSLWIQSDGAMAELAHLENRISTHLKRMEALGRDRQALTGCHLKIEALSEFNLDGLDRATDVVYFPTMGDNRVMTSLVRAMGFAAIDNYTDDGYDLEQKGRLGRQYVGDAVCLPLAAVFGDMISCVEDFLARRGKDDPVFRGKNRIVLFMHGGDGPCRLGQYIQVFKLIFWRLFSGAEIPGPTKAGVSPAQIRLLENISSSLTDKNDCSGSFEPWVGILGYQGLVVQGLCHSLLLQAASHCRTEGDFLALMADYRKLKEQLVARVAQARPGRAGRALVRWVSRYWPALAGPAKYLGYGLFDNFGLRRYFRSFAGRWIFPHRDRRRQGLQPFCIHLDGEVYMRTSQAEQILRLLISYLGYGAFEMTLPPTWCFMEAVLYTRLLAAQDRWADLDHERRSAGRIGQDRNLSAAQESQGRIAADAERTIGQLRDLLARPLYKAAGVAMPHGMREVYAAAVPIIPTGKPYGELVPFVGEAVLRCREGVDLILNVAPEGCMVSGMGDMLIPSILAQGQNGHRTAIVSLCSRDGEVREEELRMALLKAMGDRWEGVLPTDAP